MWSNLKLRQKYSISGLKRATNFSWKKTALETLAVYRLLESDEEK
jgi:glycosyltransferase involved in cell wall biosynthesis